MLQIAPEVDEYFDRKSSCWNILEYLDHYASESFQTKINRYLKSLKLIGESETGELGPTVNQRKNGKRTVKRTPPILYIYIGQDFMAALLNQLDTFMAAPLKQLMVDDVNKELGINLGQKRSRGPAHGDENDESDSNES
ncbi:hypothetical protein BC938DRAFT_476293, partial [Jimgerdemannia flammicorona]